MVFTEASLLLTGPKGRNAVFGIRPNGISQVWGSAAIESALGEDCVGMICARSEVNVSTVEEEKSGGRKVTYSRAVLNKERSKESQWENEFSTNHTWLAFSSSGIVRKLSFSPLEDAMQKSHHCNDITPWNLENLHAVHPIALLTESTRLTEANCILSIQNSPMEIHVRQNESSEALLTFSSDLHFNRLSTSAIAYVPFQDSESTQQALKTLDSHGLTIHRRGYAPIVFIAANRTFLGAFCPLQKKCVWSARKHFFVENLSVPLRLVKFCFVPISTSDRDSESGSALAQSDKLNFLICGVTSDRYLLLFEPLSRSTPIVTIRMNSFSGEPRCLCYAGKSAVLIGDSTGAVNLFDLRAALNAYRRGDGSTAEFLQDSPFSTVIQRKGGARISWIAPIPMGQHQSNENSEFGDGCQQIWSPNDSVPAWSSCLSPYFLVSNGEGCLQLFATWTKAMDKKQNVRFIGSATLPFETTLETCGLCVNSEGKSEESAKMLNNDRREEAGRFLLSRRFNQSIADFIKTNEQTVDELLGWSTLETLRE